MQKSVIQNDFNVPKKKTSFFSRLENKCSTLGVIMYAWIRTHWNQSNALHCQGTGYCVSSNHPSTHPSKLKQGPIGQTYPGNGRLKEQLKDWT
ncbi:MAG: hypothetical protein MH132_02070 [Hydrotalea sp.]|nr:hypothetical protein [Hydrotalea sp.]